LDNIVHAMNELNFISNIPEINDIIKYLESNNIEYGDLHGENIMIDLVTGKYILIDFDIMGNFK